MIHFLCENIRECGLYWVGAKNLWGKNRLKWKESRIILFVWLLVVVEFELRALDLLEKSPIKWRTVVKKIKIQGHVVIVMRAKLAEGSVYLQFIDAPQEGTEQLEQRQHHLSFWGYYIHRVYLFSKQWEPLSNRSGLWAKIKWGSSGYRSCLPLWSLTPCPYIYCGPCDLPLFAIVLDKNEESFPEYRVMTCSSL
jgi:hypothetical protein